MNNHNYMARQPIGRRRRLAPWLRRAAQSVMLTGAFFVLGGGDAIAQDSARPMLLAPQPLTLSTGETGYITRGDSNEAPSPRVTRGASPEPMPSFAAIPMTPTTAEPGMIGPDLPMPLPAGPQANPANIPPGMRPMTRPQPMPGRQTPTWTAFNPNPTNRMHPTGACINCKPRGINDFGSGWRNLINRLFGTSTSSTTRTVSNRPMPQGMMNGGMPIPSSPGGMMPTTMVNAGQGSAQMAYRWYGYGAPQPLDNPQSMDPTAMAASWYQQTGATLGAMPANGAPNTAMAQARPAPQTMVPFEQAYGPLPRSPIVQATHNAPTQQQPMGREPGKIGGVSYTPPSTVAAAKEAPIPTQAVASASPATPSHDLVPPPPLPPVRWQPRNGELPSQPTGQVPAHGNAIAALRQTPNHQTALQSAPLQQRPMQQAPLMQAGEQRAANLLPPRPLVEGTQASESRVVARAQSEDAESSFADRLTERIQRMCGSYVTAVAVRQTGTKTVVIQLTVGQHNHAEPIANKISELPELATYEVDFEVRIGNR